MTPSERAIVQGLPTRPVERYVTQRELAELMGVSRYSVMRLTKEGMPSVTFGLRTRRYLPSVALAWARSRSQDARPTNERRAS